MAGAWAESEERLHAAWGCDVLLPCYQLVSLCFPFLGALSMPLGWHQFKSGSQQAPAGPRACLKHAAMNIEVKKGPFMDFTDVLGSWGRPHYLGVL